mmetsp:Transcript_299/g.421  ORF Transcript_299/g.421 Transcript_299/m.421 type:complete len:129 (+) Transcript_299:662-1048(+)
MINEATPKANKMRIATPKNCPVTRCLDQNAIRQQMPPTIAQAVRGSRKVIAHHEVRPFSFKTNHTGMNIVETANVTALKAFRKTTIARDPPKFAARRSAACINENKTAVHVQYDVQCFMCQRVGAMRR